MEFESITHYVFNEQWNSNPLPTTILMRNGIRMQYPLIFNKQWNFHPLPNIFLMTNVQSESSTQYFYNKYKRNRNDDF